MGRPPTAVLLWLLLAYLTACWQTVAGGLAVRAVFNQQSIRGTITFSQENPDDSTLILVELEGLDQFTNESYPWHVHEYPFPLGTPNPCTAALTGGHYDPLGANQGGNYSDVCQSNPSLCEIGDLSGKFGPLNSSSPLLNVTYVDNDLSLYGVYSVIGRSIVIHRADNSRFVCANIDHPDEDVIEILYTPFRSVFGGNIYFRQHTDNFTSSVYVDLIRIDGVLDSSGHNWHVHESPVDSGDTTCLSAGPHYNPTNAPVGTVTYAMTCNSTAQNNCEIGDLSSKSAPLDVLNRVTKLLYTDTFLPLIGEDYFILNRSVVIHEENTTAPRISCANVELFRPLEAVAYFNEDGVTGNIQFVQNSPFDETIVTVSLAGLGERADGYHVHEYPVGPGDSGSDRCASEFTGGHWNPFDIGNDPAITSDEYEIGDLSGKFGNLSGVDNISDVYSDPNIPLSGPYSILGRSIVIHYPNGSRWLCSNVEYPGPVNRFSAMFNISGLRVTFIQPADDPFAETTIIVEGDFNEAFPELTVSTTPTPLTSLNLVPSSLPPSMTSATSLNLVPSSLPPSMLSTLSPTNLPTSEPTVVTSTSFDMEFLMTTVNVDTSTSADGMLMPYTTTDLVTPMPTTTPSPDGRRKRSEHGQRQPVEGEDRGRQVARDRGRRQAGPGLSWSLRSGEVTPAGCDTLPVFDPFMTASSACSSSNPLACSAGDLTSKHGPLQSRNVFTDPNLPLSGPNSVLGSGGQAVLLVQPMSPSGSNQLCAQVVMDVPPEATPTLSVATPTTSSVAVLTSSVVNPTTTPSAVPPPEEQEDDGDDLILIGAIAGGVGGAVLLAVLLIVITLLCCCCRRRGRYDVAKDKNSSVEMGTVRPTEPLIGSSQYRVLHDYVPRKNDDLAMMRGDWVTLIEAPYGGEWWRGSINGQEGWFPKSYVEWVNIEAEKKKIQEDNLTLAAAAIVVASKSFSARHPSLSQKRGQTTKVSPKPVDPYQRRRARTLNKQDIDSTPKLVTKFDRSGREEKEDLVIENVGKEGSVSGGSRPDTPKSQRGVEVITNLDALEAGYSPHPSPQLGTHTPVAVSPLVLATPNVNTLLQTDRYEAMYDFTGSTGIELLLRKGDIVNVFERADNGWWRGTHEGRVGWFPETYVKPAPGPGEARQVQPEVGQPRAMEEMMMSQGEDLEATEYRALYTFQSATDGDLNFGEGETVLVYWAHDSGWWFGAAGSEQGWFPGSFVEPVVDISEAGSMAASPAPTGEDGEEEGGSLAGEIVAMLKFRQNRKKSKDEGQTKDKKKRKFSLKRKDRRSGSETESSSRSESVASSLPSEEPMGLQGELAAALVRHTSSSVGRQRTLSIDERVAIMKETKSNEGEPQSELLSILSKRKKPELEAPSGETPRTESEEGREPSPVGNEPASETVTGREEGTEPASETVAGKGEGTELPSETVVGREPSHEGTAKASPVQEGEAPPTGELLSQESAESSQSPQQQQAPAEMKDVEEEGKKSEEKKSEGEAPAIPTSTPEGRDESSATPTGEKGPRRHTESPQSNKPRRKAPPPPSPLAVSPVPVASTVTTQPKPTSPQPKTTSPRPHAPSPRLNAPRPHAPSPPNAPSPRPNVPSPRSNAPSPPNAYSPRPHAPSPKVPARSPTPKSATLAQAPTTPRAAPSPQYGNLSPKEIPKSHTMAASRAKQPQVTRHTPKNRRMTGVEHKSKPRRIPPPPPPSKPTARTAHKLETVTEDTDGVFVETPLSVAPRVHPLQTARTEPPRPAPRMRPRVQRVKRPLSRTIPPPPNIPLPPPPIKKRTVIPQAEAKPQTLPSQTVTPPTSPVQTMTPQGSPAQTVTAQASPLQTMTPSSESSEGTKTAKPALKPKPPVLPKPAHLTKGVTRRHSESSLSSISSKESDGGTTSPNSDVFTSAAPAVLRKPRGPKPPPPARTSSLSSDGDRPVLRKQTPLPSISDAIEETDSAQVEKKETTAVSKEESSEKLLSRSEPPSHPPPRPNISKAKDEPDTGLSDEVVLKRRSEPPSFPPPPRPTVPQANGIEVTPKSSTLPSETLHGKVLYDDSKQEKKQPLRRQSSSGASLLAKGSNLMRSLKKIVKRSESRKEDGEERKTEDEGRKTSRSEGEGRKTSRSETEVRKTSTSEGEGKAKPPPRPEPPKLSTSKSQEPEVSWSSPVAKSRTKIPTSEAAAQPPPQPDSVKKVEDKEPPARPPPPNLEATENAVSETPKSPQGTESPKGIETPKSPEGTESPKSPQGIETPKSTETPKSPEGTVSPKSPQGIETPKSTEAPKSPQGTDNKPVPLPRKDVDNKSVKSAELSSEMELSDLLSRPFPTFTPRKSSQPSSPVQTPTNFFRAKVDYKAHNDNELSFTAGDILIEIEHQDDGFHYGMLDDGSTGLFPDSCVEPFYSPGR